MINRNATTYVGFYSRVCRLSVKLIGYSETFRISNWTIYAHVLFTVREFSYPGKLYALHRSELSRRQMERYRQASSLRINRVPQVDKDPHGSSHRWPLIAETRELASAINSASHAASTVGRKGDCKGSLVTEHCVTQVYIAAPRVLPASHSLPCHVKDIHASPFGALPIRSFVLFVSIAILRGIIKSRLLYTLCCRLLQRLDFSLGGIQFSATIIPYFNSLDTYEFQGLILFS